MFSVVLLLLVDDFSAHIFSFLLLLVGNFGSEYTFCCATKLLLWLASLTRSYVLSVVRGAIPFQSGRDRTLLRQHHVVCGVVVVWGVVLFGVEKVQVVVGAQGVVA